MARYSTILLDHFQNPRNLGTLEEPDGTAFVINPVCGDEMRLDLRIRDGHITQSRFQARGCTAAIAAGSLVTEMIQGKSLQQALTIRKEDVAAALGGLPPEKHHCSVLGCQAVRSAIHDYRSRHKRD